MPWPQETPTDQKDRAGAQRDAAKAEQVHCANCNLQGHLTMFRKKTRDCEGYTGEPTCELTDHNGEVIKVRARIVCHCSCLVGQWMRDNTYAAIISRIPTLRVVGIKGGGMENWTQHDPTEPECNPGDIPDWAAFRRQIAASSIVKSARDVLREKPQHRIPAVYRPDPRHPDPILDPRPNPAFVPDDAGPAFVPDGSKPPF